MRTETDEKRELATKYTSLSEATRPDEELLGRLPFPSRQEAEKRLVHLDRVLT